MALLVGRGRVWGPDGPWLTGRRVLRAHSAVGKRRQHPAGRGREASSATRHRIPRPRGPYPGRPGRASVLWKQRLSSIEHTCSEVCGLRALGAARASVTGSRRGDRDPERGAALVPGPRMAAAALLPAGCAVQPRGARLEPGRRRGVRAGRRVSTGLGASAVPGGPGVLERVPRGGGGCLAVRHTAFRRRPCRSGARRPPALQAPWEVAPDTAFPGSRPDGRLLCSFALPGTGCVLAPGCGAPRCPRCAG